MRPPHVVVVGSVNADMVVKSRRLPAPGETVTGGRFLMAAGGKGANQAVAAARLGAAVALVAKVGQDALGEEAIANYQREGICTDCVLRDSDSPTGVALILIDDRGENLISVASGANHALKPSDIEQITSRISTADVLMLQLGSPMDTVCAAAAIAAQANVPVILDPAPAAPAFSGSVETRNLFDAQRVRSSSIDGNRGCRQRFGTCGGRSVVGDGCATRDHHPGSEGSVRGWA